MPRPAIERFFSRIEFTNDCWWWTGASGGERQRAGFRNEQGKFENAARFTFRMLRGPIPEGLCVLHECDNGMCVNPLHLFLGTRAVNNTDRHLKDRDGQKLKQLDAVEILILSQSGIPKREISLAYDISRSQFFRIQRGDRWKELHAI